tara:strand:+ start:127 stop:411 length:285 start_codon:yes stop_codon:yes gene_type:complete
MMGRAKQQIELGGGTWDESKTISKTLRKEAKETDRYGGDFKFKGGDDASVTAALKAYGTTGKMGKARKAIEAAGGTWSKALHKRLKAEAKRKKK